jgi:hypothetical protein
MEELWKDIEGYEGYYQVSNHGRVKSLERVIESNGGPQYVQPSILEGKLSRKGYRYFHFRKDGKERNCYVHRLVASAFLANNQSKPEVNHIDGNKDNNHILNLEWVTKSENMQHAVRTGLSIPNNELASEARRKKVINIITGKLYQSAKSAAEENGLVYSTLKSRLNGSQKNNTSLRYL